MGNGENISKVGEQVHKFERQVLQFVQQEQLVTSGDRLIIACSGGVDSMALLSFCLQLQDVKLVVAHIDHMLRGQQSYDDYLFVEDFCKKRGIAFEGTRINIAELHEKQGGNLQRLCRDERYSFLRSVMQKHKANKLLTAHHADDQLESMLMAITKSASVSSLQGIQMRRRFGEGEIIRPFLTVKKAELREYLQSVGVSYREDASNAKDSYTRNRIRHHVVPLLEAENAQVSSHAVQLAMQLADDERYLQQQTRALYSQIVTTGADDLYQFEIEALLAQPVALQRRLILILLNYIYNDTNTFQRYTLCTAILSLCRSSDGSAEVHLPQGIIARRQYERLSIGQYEKLAPATQKELRLNEWNEFIGVRVYIGETSKVPTLTANNTLYYFSTTSIALPLRVRTRQQGDKMHCLGMTQAKKLSRIFIDEKIPLHARDEWPILVDNNNEILALLGIRVSSIFSKHKRANDNYVLVIDRLHSCI